MLDTVRAHIDRLRLTRGRVTVAIDGRCAAGKTTLAEALRTAYGCNVFHMDDFFLRPEQRTPERYAQPGGNVDRERFLAEVLKPTVNGVAVTLRAFDCHTMTVGAGVIIDPTDITVVEGTYSCHPELWDHYDLHIFLTVPPTEQFARLARREGANLTAFRERWIPLEERYFAECVPKERCELVFSTDRM